MVLTSTSSGPELPPPTSFVLRPFFVLSGTRGWLLTSAESRSKGKATAMTKEDDLYTVEQAAKILKLQRQLDEARRPWWRKMFG